MLGKIDPSALLGAKNHLRKVEEPTPGGNAASRLATEESVTTAEARAITGLQTEEQRVAYFLDGGVDAWYGELKACLSANRGGQPAFLGIDDVTFPTLQVDLKRSEKILIHSLFAEVFGDEDGVEDVGSGPGPKTFDFDVLERTLNEVDNRLRTADELSALRTRLDEAIRTQGGAVFVKLTTRSPKDSYAALCGARRVVKEAKKHNEDETVDHNLLWTTFAEHLRLQQKVTSPDQALLLLASSRRVYEDLQTDLFDHPSGSCDQDQIQLSIRGFDEKVTPQTEFRGFVWNKQFVCCGQYFHQLFFPHLAEDSETLERISVDFRTFYSQVMAPNMPEFLKKCPCFMMDLVWKQNLRDGESSRVMLTEVNPFDGETLGVFPASTGLFRWDDMGDRRLMMGKCGQECFELRVRKSLLITENNLKLHPELRNMSPVWKACIYGD